MITTLPINSWHDAVAEDQAQRAVAALESGQVIKLPDLAFPLLDEEQQFLVAEIADPKNKNISFDHRNNTLQGMICAPAQQVVLKKMLHRYAVQAQFFLQQLLPMYQSDLIQGRTSYRPVEIANRKAPSYRKDDTRLHVDAFPANPTQGRRILRVFTNVNPHGQSRVWRLGAPFEQVATTFLPKLTKPIWGSARLYNTLNITKNKRTPYDHYMLQLHDKMKADVNYQRTVTQQEVLFAPHTSWIVFTDQVSHAAMGGQFTFEQTFYLPAHSLTKPEQSPLRVLERLLHRALM